MQPVRHHDTARGDRQRPEGGQPQGRPSAGWNHSAPASAARDDLDEARRRCPRRPAAASHRRAASPEYGNEDPPGSGVCPARAASTRPAAPKTARDARSLRPAAREPPALHRGRRMTDVTTPTGGGAVPGFSAFFSRSRRTVSRLAGFPSSRGLAREKQDGQYCQRAPPVSVTTCRSTAKRSGSRTDGGPARRSVRRRAGCGDAHNLNHCFSCDACPTAGPGPLADAVPRRAKVSVGVAAPTGRSALGTCQAARLSSIGPPGRAERAGGEGCRLPGREVRAKVRSSRRAGTAPKRSRGADRRAARACCLVARLDWPPGTTALGQAAGPSSPFGARGPVRAARSCASRRAARVAAAREERAPLWQRSHRDAEDRRHRQRGAKACGAEQSSPPRGGNPVRGGVRRRWPGSRGLRPHRVPNGARARGPVDVLTDQHASAGTRRARRTQGTKVAAARAQRTIPPRGFEAIRDRTVAEGRRVLRPARCAPRGLLCGRILRWSSGASRSERQGCDHATPAARPALDVALPASRFCARRLCSPECVRSRPRASTRRRDHGGGNTRPNVTASRCPRASNRSRGFIECHRARRSLCGPAALRERRHGNCVSLPTLPARSGPHDPFCVAALVVVVVLGGLSAAGDPGFLERRRRPGSLGASSRRAS